MKACQWLKSFERKQNHIFFISENHFYIAFLPWEVVFKPCGLTVSTIPLQIEAFQHMQHFVQTMQQQAQHAIATEDQQHKQELHKLMARSARGPGPPFSSRLKAEAFPEVQDPYTFQTKLMLWWKEGDFLFSCFGITFSSTL